MKLSSHFLVLTIMSSIPDTDHPFKLLRDHFKRIHPREFNLFWKIKRIMNNNFNYNPKD